MKKIILIIFLIVYFTSPVFTQINSNPINSGTIVVSKYFQFISRAADSLSKSIARRSEELEGNIFFGPNIFDLCYFYRFNPGKRDIYGSRSYAELLKQMKLAVSVGLPVSERDVQFYNSGSKIPADSRTIVGEAEWKCVNLINYFSRTGYANSNGKVFIVKHFPGGNASMEFTEESPVIFDFTLDELKSKYCGLFISLLQRSKKDRPKAVMTAHATYPNALNELVKIHPNFKCIFPNYTNVPASLSPLMLRGFLREDIGFDGLIISDWVDNPKSISSFLSKNRDSLPEQYRSLPHRELAAAAAIFAGVNWIGGLRVIDLEGLQKVYNTDPQFKNVFDTMALESLFLRLKLIPHSQKLIGIDLNNVSLKDLYTEQFSLPKAISSKLKRLKKLLIGKTDDETFWNKVAMFTDHNKYSLPMYKHSRIRHVIKPFVQSDDIWNRGGILVMEFRKNFINEMSGTKFPSFFDNEKKDGREWLTNLFKDKKFTEEYGKMDWNSSEMKIAYETFLNNRLSSNE